MTRIPEGGLAALTDDDLAALEAAVISDFTGIDLAGTPDEDTLAQAESLADDLRTIRGENAERAERRVRAEALAVEFAEPEPEPVAEETQPEPVAEEAQQTDDQVAEEAAEVAYLIAEAEEILAEAPEPEPVVASGTTPIERAAQNAPPPTLKEKRVSVITAAADTGLPAGAEIDGIANLVTPFRSRLRAISPGSTGNASPYRQKAMVASVHIDSEFAASTDAELAEAMESASRARMFASDTAALTAAAGWASPSETVYDLCQYEQAVDLLALPEVAVTRGGLRYTREPTFATIYAGTSFDVTEAQVIAESPAKGNFEVPTPAFVDVRLDAVGFWLKAGILQQAAYPELVQRVLEGCFVAHQYRVNAKMLTAMNAAATAGPAIVEQGAFTSNLEAVPFAADSVRTLFRIPDSHVVNIVLPKWAKVSYKADIARRSGRVAAAVSDAEVTEWFTSRNVRPQFVYGWDELDVSSNIQVEGKATITNALLYPEGTFVKLMAPVIELSAMYDSTLLATNEYSHAFVEQGVELAHRCLGAYSLDIPVTATGRTGANDLTEPHGTVEA